MQPRERLVAALERRPTDRLPATTHHLVPWYMDQYFGTQDHQAFWDRFGLDPVRWAVPCRPHPDEAARPHPDDPNLLVGDRWRVEIEPLADRKHPTHRYRVTTPRGELTWTIMQDPQMTWQMEHAIKDKGDIEKLAYLPAVALDREALDREDEAAGRGAMLRGHIVGIPFYGQPGVWQDAACLVGIEKLIMESLTDPAWVHELLGILMRHKLKFVETLEGAPYDVLELGGGDASCTVISPALFEQFVAPYDMPIIEAAHARGQRIVYHTCGGMMAILEMVADMGVDAMETFTPRDMGGDTVLAAAKRRIGDRVCMIGGFDQFHFFTGCTPGQTRAEVRRCFEAAGEGGGYILSPSDHFFEAEPDLLEAFADEARQCRYPVTA